MPDAGPGQPRRGADVFLNRTDRTIEVWFGGLDPARVAEITSNYETIRLDPQVRKIVADMTLRWLELALTFAVRTLEESGPISDGDSE